MTQTQTDSSQRYTRRGLMRRTALGIGATASIGGGASRLGASPVGGASAFAPIAIGGAVAAGGAALYIHRNVDINGAIDNWIGDSDEEYDTANAEATHSQIRENALAALQADTAVIGNMSNLLNASSNHVIAQAKKAAIDELNQSNGATAAKDAATAEVDEFFSTQEKNLLSHYSAQAGKFANWVNQANGTTGLASVDVFAFNGTTSLDAVSSTSNTDTLVDGSSYTYDSYEFKNDSGTTLATINQGEDVAISIQPVDTGETIDALVTADYKSLFSEIATLHGNISSEMTTWVDGVQPSYAAGDVSTADMISANDLIGDSFEEDNDTWAGASLASMGLRGSSFGMTIELLDDGREVEGTIYHQDESINSLSTGVTYSPSNDIAGTVYIAYQDDSGSSLDELKQRFIIHEIRDKDGETRDSATYTSSNQQTYNQDIEQIQRELDQVTALREQLENERDAAAYTPTSGGGGGFLSGSDQNWGLIAVGAGVAAIGWGYVTGEDQ